MNNITKAGCVVLAGFLAAGAAGCKRSEPVQDQRIQNANTGFPPNQPPVAKKVNKAFVTEAKTPNGEDIYRMESGGIRFVLPKSWTALPDETRMSLASEDNALRIMITVPESEDYDQVVNNLSEELGKIIQNAKPEGVAMRTKLNGMAALTQHGVGDLDDATVNWKIDVVKAKRPIIILSYATIEIDEQHNADYGAFMDSIQPLS